MFVIIRFCNEYSDFRHSLWGRRYKNCIRCDSRLLSVDIVFLTKLYTIVFDSIELRLTRYFPRFRDKKIHRDIYLSHHLHESGVDLRDMSVRQYFDFFGAILVYRAPQ